MSCSLSGHGIIDSLSSEIYILKRLGSKWLKRRKVFLQKNWKDPIFWFFLLFSVFHFWYLWYLKRLKRRKVFLQEIFWKIPVFCFQLFISEISKGCLKRRKAFLQEIFWENWEVPVTGRSAGLRDGPGEPFPRMQKYLLSQMQVFSSREILFPQVHRC